MKKKRGRPPVLWHNPKVGRKFAMAVWEQSSNGKKSISWAIRSVLNRPEFRYLRRYIKKGKRPYSYLEQQFSNCRNKFWRGIDGADLTWFSQLSTPTYCRVAN